MLTKNTSNRFIYQVFLEIARNHKVLFKVTPALFHFWWLLADSLRPTTFFCPQFAKSGTEPNNTFIIECLHDQGLHLPSLQRILPLEEAACLPLRHRFCRFLNLFRCFFNSCSIVIQLFSKDVYLMFVLFHGLRSFLTIFPLNSVINS